MAYDAVYALAEAAKNTGDNLTRETLKEELDKISIDTLLGRMEFDEEGKVRRQYKVVGYENDTRVELAGYDFMNQ